MFNHNKAVVFEYERERFGVRNLERQRVPREFKCCEKLAAISKKCMIVWVKHKGQSILNGKSRSLKGAFYLGKVFLCIHSAAIM